MKLSTQQKRFLFYLKHVGGSMLIKGNNVAAHLLESKGMIKITTDDEQKDLDIAEITVAGRELYEQLKQRKRAMTDSIKFAVEVARALGWEEKRKSPYPKHDGKPYIKLFSGSPGYVCSKDDETWLPDSNANDDYDVLVEVRAWELNRQQLFYDCLHSIWAEPGCPVQLPLNYQIGDYARAVLAVAEKEKSDE